MKKSIILFCITPTEKKNETKQNLFIYSITIVLSNLSNVSFVFYFVMYILYPYLYLHM